MKIEEVCERLGWDCPSNIENYPGSLLARIMSIVEELEKSVKTYTELAQLNSFRVEELEEENQKLRYMVYKLTETLVEISNTGEGYDLAMITAADAVLDMFSLDSKNERNE